MTKQANNSEKCRSLREQLKELIEFMDVTQEDAAEIIDEYFGKESKTFVESFKADLKRCTKEQKLKNYMAILKCSEKYQKIEGIRARYEGDTSILGKDTQKYLHQISKEISEYIDKIEVERENNIQLFSSKIK